MVWGSRGSLMVEMGLEDSLEGVKDFDREKNEPRDSEKGGQTGVRGKPGVAPGGPLRGPKGREGGHIQNVKLGVVVLVANV